MAQTGVKRAKAFAEIPTVAEQGYTGFNASIWFGLVGPARMPADLVARINADVNRILGQARRALSHEELLNRDYYRGRFATHKDGRPVFNWEEDADV